MSHNPQNIQNSGEVQAFAAAFKEYMEATSRQTTITKIEGDMDTHQEYTGELVVYPQVGKQVFLLFADKTTYFRTSPVQEIVQEDAKTLIVRTNNSTYRVVLS